MVDDGVRQMMTAERVCRSISFAFAVLSTAAATGLFLACISCGRGRPRTSEWTHQQAIRHLVTGIALADILASLTWVSAQAGQLFGGDTTAMCAFEGIGGMVAFVSMSLWTCILAHYLDWALSHPGPDTSSARGPGAFSQLLVWGCACGLATLIAPWHVESCRPGHATNATIPPIPPGEHASSPTRRLAQSTWIAVYVAGPSFVLVYLVLLYGRTHLRFRRTAILAAEALASDPLAPGKIGAPSRLTFALDVRLLSYLLAYMVCELPALPAAFADLGGMSSNDVTTYDSSFSVLIALRMLLPPLQGTANALAYVHHARPWRQVRWLSQSMSNIATPAEAEYNGE